MAARAQLRIGVCQEKLGLAQARQTYEAVRDKYPDQPQVETEAVQRLESADQREATIDWPSRSTVSESVIRHLLQATEPWPSLADSALINEQMYRQLEAVGQQMEQVKRQLEQARRQFEAFQQQKGGFHFEQVYQSYAYTPPVVPYPHEEVAEVPMQWKFRLEVDGLYPQRHAYADPDLDDSEWATIDIGRAWEDQGYAGYDKGAWYRTKFTMAADSVRPVLMAFGGVDKDAFLYVNGQLVGQHHGWNLPFILDISDHVVRDGENAVALYVYDGKLMGGVYGLINVHQPTNEVKTDEFAANRGGSLDRMHKGSNWARVRFLKSERSKPSYGSYARRPPRIPYSHQTVAEVPMQWKFCFDVGEPNPQRNREYAAPDFDD